MTSRGPVTTEEAGSFASETGESPHMIATTESDDEEDESNLPGTSLAAEAQGQIAPLTKPLDVFAEIGSYLGPQDVLRLARCSEGLRAILMSKSARNIWRSARMGVEKRGGLDFPACPLDMSEPEYASLLFDRFCMSCNAGKAKRFNLLLRERLCGICSEKKNYRRYTKSGLVDFIDVCVPSGEIPPELSTIYGLLLCHPNTGQFCPSVARHLHKKCMAKKAQLSSSSYALYLQERGQKMAAARKHAKELEAWYHEP